MPRSRKKPKAAPPKRAPGRPTLYTTKLANTICELLEDGSTITAACKKVRITTATFRLWQSTNPEFSASSARARESGADMLVEIAAAKLERATPKNICVIREQVQHIRWRASKLRPKVYGERTAITGSEGGPVQVRLLSFAESKAVLEDKSGG